MIGRPQECCCSFAGVWLFQSTRERTYVCHTRSELDAVDHALRRWLSSIDRAWRFIAVDWLYRAWNAEEE